METVLDKDTVDHMYRGLSTKLKNVVPDIELRYKAELACRINALKETRNAVILGHNYMEPALYHSITDIRGDSLELSRAVTQVNKDIIVFCGVRFMAETAKILNPTKTVLFPGRKGGCSLADGITAEDVRQLKQMFPGVPVVAYVNTRADVKAESDICCTSGNAAHVVESLHTDTVIFIPDEYLARNVAKETGKHIIFPATGPRPQAGTELDYQMIGWHARCEVHDKFTPEDVRNVRAQFPEVVILAHPECKPEVIEVSDFTGSTAAMIQFVETTKAPQYLLLTECSMGDNVAAANPDKEMLRLCSVRCPHMNEITLEDTLHSLENLREVIDIPEPIRQRAYKSVERMLQIS